MVYSQKFTTGEEPDFDERTELLDDIINVMTDFKAERAEKKQSKDAEVQRGMQLAQDATKRLSERHEDAGSSVSEETLEEMPRIKRAKKSETDAETKAILEFMSVQAEAARKHQELMAEKQAAATKDLLLALIEAMNKKSQ